MSELAKRKIVKNCKALEEAFRYDARAIVEQGIEAREIEVAILGNEDVRTTLPGSGERCRFL